MCDIAHDCREGQEVLIGNDQIVRTVMEARRVTAASAVSLVWDQRVG